MQTSLAPASPAPTPPSPPPKLPRLSTFSTILIAVWGIVMPAITNLVEALTHMCADSFFDPLPSVGHLFAVAAVPLANAAALWVLKTRDGRDIQAAIFAQAFAVAIAAVYSLMFLPLTPLALF